MRVTPDMTIKEVLGLDEHMVEAFAWLASDFERLQDPALRGVMAERVTVEQASRMAHQPLAESLYVLNLKAGEEEKPLAQELLHLSGPAFEYHEMNPSQKPRELLGLADDDPLVHFVDVMPGSRRFEDPQPAIARELDALRRGDEVLLVRHPFDPVPLRDKLAARGFASWAEERRPHEWYVYFYRPHAGAGAVAYRPLKAKAMAAGAAK